MPLFSSPFAPEPAFTHGAAPRTAVLLCNLGTPEAPEPAAVRRYLAEFLSDPRVVEIPRALWLLILHGIILRTRPARSAAKYASIWTPQGSPLKVWSERQGALLQARLQARGQRVLVRCAMRYGTPSVAAQLDALKAEGATRVLVLPAYPQYSAATTASVFDAVYLWARRQRRLPELRFVNHCHDHPGYIAALAGRIRAHWAAHGAGDHLVMSFHGVPQRTLTLGDPYHCECQVTARLLAQALQLPPERYSVTFQSRFGRAQWLEPATEPALVQRAREGGQSVDVVCPGFTSDCLETLEEIAQEARQAFVKAGGRRFGYIPCLNDDPAWIEALADLSLQHLAGWPTDAAQAGAEAARHAEGHLRAQQMGAQR